MLLGVGHLETFVEINRWIDELTRRWERYLAHDPQVPLPPERERIALERRLRVMSRQEYRTAVDQFKLEQVLNRFTTYSQLWQRQLREREEARTRREVGSARPNVAAGAPVQTSGEDVERLHGRYLEALKAVGKDANVNLEGFRRALDSQRQALEAKGATVSGFDIVEEGGQVKVRARVVRGRSQ